MHNNDDEQVLSSLVVFAIDVAFRMSVHVVRFYLSATARRFAAVCGCIGVLFESDVVVGKQQSRARKPSGSAVGMVELPEDAASLEEKETVLDEEEQGTYRLAFVASEDFRLGTRL